MLINREQIIKKLADELKVDPFIFAFWLEGADALNTVDDYSDIDIWLDVQDGHESVVMEQIHAVLSQIAPLDFEHEVEHPHPKIRQNFFHLQGTSEFLIIDVCIQSHSREFWFTKGSKDEEAKIIFDKKGVVAFRDLDETKFRDGQKNRVEELKKTFPFFSAWVKKEVKRNNFLEAVSYYRPLVLDPLVELLRIRYEPTKREFGLKHIKRDLPHDVFLQLEDLYKVNSVSEINMNLDKANTLFFEVLKEVEKENKSR